MGRQNGDSVLTFLKTLVVVKGKMQKYCFGTYLHALPFLLVCAKTIADEGLCPPVLCVLGWKGAF